MTNLTKILNKEVVDKLTESIAFIDEDTYYALSNLLGVELIVSTEGAPDGKYKLSRLGLANAFINDAATGLRLAITIEEDGECSDINFIDLSKQYNEKDLKYAKEMCTRKIFDLLLVDAGIT